MRTYRRIRTNPNRAKIRTAVRVIHSLISYPMRRRIMVKIIVSTPIIAGMMNMRTIVRSTIGMIMIRQTEVEQTTIRIIHINPETPSSSGHINRPIKIIGSHEPAILSITQYPTKIVITDVQRFIIVIHRPFITTCHVIHDITDRINKVVINLIRIIILLSGQIQFIRHLICQETRLLTNSAIAHSGHTHTAHGSYPDGK